MSFRASVSAVKPRKIFVWCSSSAKDKWFERGDSPLRARTNEEICDAVGVRERNAAQRHATARRRLEEPRVETEKNKQP